MYFRNRNDVEPKVLVNGHVGGVIIDGTQAIRVVMAGEDMLLCDIEIKKGYFHPPHSHPDNESIGMVIKGKLRMTVGGETRDLPPGATWHHGKGVEHSTYAYEDTQILELHSPRRPDLDKMWEESLKK